MQLVVLDPPFDTALWEPALKAAARAVSPQGWIYLEAPVAWTESQLTALGLTAHRHLKAGAVHAHLLRLASPEELAAVDSASPIETSPGV